MSGYNWNNGMSNNAVAAYGAGLLPASKLAAALRARGYNVDTSFIRENFIAREWHHTSGKFNQTDFYDLDTIIDRIENNSDLQARIAESAVNRRARAAARKQTGSYLADVTVTDWIEERVHNGYYRGRSKGYRKVRRPSKYTFLTATVTEIGDTMIEVNGTRRKASNCEIVRLSPAEIRRRRNLEIAAKRKATIAAKRAAREAAIQTLELFNKLKAESATRAMLALPAPAPQFQKIENRGIDYIRAELGLGYVFNAPQRAVVRHIAHDVAVKAITFESARQLVAEQAKKWAGSF